jgi:chemotaxis regulatin CheY-phosphate phosphatase CheZ
MTIDERLEFLVQSTESLHENVAKLVETSERHERELERFRRAMRAALVAWLDEGENGGGTQQG